LWSEKTAGTPETERELSDGTVEKLTTAVSSATSRNQAIARTPCRDPTTAGPKAAEKTQEHYV
jgi:hypothetical protein